MLTAGQTFAHFKIIKHLGSGGMGEVYLAEDQKLHRQVAIKILLADFFNEPERLRRFEREAKTAAQIMHPNIMAIYDMGEAMLPDESRKVQYIVMERVQGTPLFEYLQTKQPDLGDIVRIAEKIASGLAAAHKLNIVHRDIKSSNILVDDEGNPKILDFGLAKPLDPVQMDDDTENTDTVSQELTKAGKIVGTVSYMSPEQARGEQVDVRSDIFSFGILLYRMATGEFPFSGPSQVETLAKILETKHEPPSGKKTGIPLELERIIDKCLQKNPNDRYQSAADLVVDLRNLRRQYDSGISDSVTGISKFSGRKTKTKIYSLSWTKLLVGVLVLAVLVVGAVKLFHNTNPGTLQNTETSGNTLAILGFENKTGDKSLDWLQTGLPEILMTDLAQSEAITIISSDRIRDYLRTKHSDQDIKQLTYSDRIKAAKFLGATNVLSGALYKLGSKVRIDARLEDIASGKIILGEKVVGDDPFTLVDSLTEKIAASLNIADMMQTSSSVASLTTTSPKAYKLYHQGMEKFGLELYDEAIEKFNEAIDIDSTFALAYMRIGMANVFSGKQQEGAKYFARAVHYKDKLPIREKTLLDLYADIWLYENYESAAIKIETYVANYPDDLEGRTFYAIMYQAFNNDTVKAFAQLDTVLQINPGFQLALSWYAQAYEQYDLIENAIKYTQLIKKYHPESPAPYSSLAQLYKKQGLIDEAIKAYEDALKRFPERPGPYASLSSLYIIKRDFKKALEYQEKYKEAVKDDPYKLSNYYYNRTNLAFWEGKFKTGMSFLFQALKEAQRTNDDIEILGALQSIAANYRRLGMLDSSLYYFQKTEKYATGMRSLNYPLGIVSTDASKCSEIRPKFEKAIKDFQERMPSSLWSLVDDVKEMFDGYCENDSAKIISSLRSLIKSRTFGSRSNNRRELGKYLILTGQYKEGKEILLGYVTGNNPTASGYMYPYLTYLIGVANEGLGNKQEAIENYKEMLKYWGNPEIELKQIADARKRLAKLTS